MANILKGKIVAERIDAQSIEILNELKNNNINPTLAILRVGDNEADISYQNSAIKKANSLGINVNNIELPKDIAYEEFYSKLDELNNDRNIHGILMLRPLPSYLDNDKARKYIKLEKDIDGCSDEALASIFTNSNNGFAPCTAEAAIKILDFYNIEIQSKNIVILGRSLVIGKPLSMMLLNRNATVTICHSKTINMKQICKNADIIISAIGKCEMIDDSYIGRDQTIIDVGINYNEIKQKICGDVLYDKVEPYVYNITPVPGGVGSITTSVLMNHVVLAAQRGCPKIDNSF